VIDSAKSRYPRFDGWIMLNVEQIKEVLGDLDIALPHSSASDTKTQPTSKPVMHAPTKPPEDLPTGDEDLPQHSYSVASFFQVLCEGDAKHLFDFVRGMRQGNEEDVQHFLNEVVIQLDRIHEHRVDGAGYIDPLVLERTRCFSNTEIEELIAILVRSVDHRYAVPEIGVKMALIRALEYIRKSRSN
jgi:hypothetical protein